MPQVFFENPNQPEQPAKGVYRWFCRGVAGEVTIYVGCAGNRRQTVAAPSTLKRGIQEAQRSCVSSDKGKLLDTDFIVGTALAYVKQQGFDCVWQHVSDEPRDEGALRAKLQPLLQSRNTKIDTHFRLPKPDAELWVPTDVVLAESLLLPVLNRHLGPRIK